MDKLKRWIRNNLLFFISLVLLGGSLVFTTVILIEFRITSQLESTSVGHIYLGNVKSSYDSILNQEILDFYLEAEYKISYQKHELEIDLDYFEFDMKETKNNITVNQNNLAYFSLSANNLSELENDILSTFGTDVYDNLDLTMIVDAISNNLSSLELFSNLDLSDFFVSSIQSSVLISKTYNLSDQTILNNISTMSPFTVGGMSNFSLLANTADYTFDNETLSFIASATLNLLLESHFDNFIFHQYDQMPSWASSGMNVKILRVNNFDLQFFNGFQNDYQVSYTVNNSSVTVELIGLPYADDYDISTLNTVIPYNTIYVEDSSLDDIAYKVSETDTEIVYQKLLEPGVDGEVKTFQRTITLSTGETIVKTIFYERIESIPEIISENIVEKVGG
jgi:hypothetical protein